MIEFGNISNNLFLIIAKDLPSPKTYALTKARKEKIEDDDNKKRETKKNICTQLNFFSKK